MESLRSIVGTVVALIIVAFVVALLVTSAIYAVALVLPLIGLTYALAQAAASIRLWRSGGHLQLRDGVRVISAGHARALGIASCTEGAGALLLSFVPALFVFGAAHATVSLLVVGLTLLAGGRAARTQVSRHAHPIDILPPERRSY